MEPNWTATLAVWQTQSSDPGSDPTVIAAINVSRDYAPADGLHANYLAISTLYALGTTPAPYIDVKIDVLDQGGAPASDVGVFRDAYFKDPIGARIQTDANGVAVVFLNCTAKGARTYSFVATPVWPNADPVSQQINFANTGIISVPPGALTIQSVTGNTNVFCLGDLTTPLQVQVTQDLYPLAGDTVSGGLLDADQAAAGDVGFDLPVCDQDQKLIVKVFPNQTGPLTLELTDNTTGNTGTLALNVVRFVSITISSDPPVVTNPCPDGITLSVEITPEPPSAAQPSGVVLQWRGGDKASEQYFAGSPPVTTRRESPATFQFTTHPITLEDLQTYDLGNIFVALDVYGIRGSGIPFTVYYRIPFEPSIKILQPPIADFATHITDAVLQGCSELPGVPFDIPIVADAILDDKGLIGLYGRMSPGPLDPGDDQFISAVMIDKSLIGKTALMFAPINNPIFQQNGAVSLYYMVISGNRGYSQPLRLNVDRGSRTNTPLQTSDYLTLPTPTPRSYLLDDYQQDEILAVRVDFLGRIKPNVGDSITVRLDLIGSTEANLNFFIPLSLNPYIITDTDLANGNQNIAIDFDLRSGSRAGFLPQVLAQIDASMGELYYVYEPVKGSPVRSRGRALQLDTVSPHSAVRLAKQRRRAPA